MLVTNTKRLKSLKNVFHFERTFEKYCILIKKRKNQDLAIFGVFNHNELYFYLLRYRFYITSKRIKNDCYKYNKVKKIRAYITF